MTSVNALQDDLLTARELFYDKLNLSFGNLKIHSESTEYGACSFELRGRKVEHRVSKITPTKTGQFVATWKRNEDGATEPFSSLDPVDFMIITSKSETGIGQFIFPKSVLVEKGIISHQSNAGKRGLRVYPPWDTPTNKQAEKSQSWQTKYFVLINKEIAARQDFIESLF
ncbi:MepB family protein [Cytophagaceae bacterium ABcell3]|nr:MepB family protein [Cytophagaceae bacterium ABcell3]